MSGEPIRSRFLLKILHTKSVRCARGLKIRRFLGQEAEPRVLPVDSPQRGRSRASARVVLRFDV